jgi:hypothetical protein
MGMFFFLETSFLVVVKLFPAQTGSCFVGAVVACRALSFEPTTLYECTGHNVVACRFVADWRDRRRKGPGTVRDDPITVLLEFVQLPFVLLHLFFIRGQFMTNGTMTDI